MRVLILGATGMLGHKLWQTLPGRFADIHATVRSRPRLPGCTLFDSARVIDGVDAADFRTVAAVLDRLGPQAIINCVAVTKRRQASGAAVASIALNALLPHQLAAWGAANGARVIHFSTDCVFAGRTGGYTEASPTDAEDLYGRTKALGEIAGENSLTLRTSFIGRELGSGTELLEWFLAQRGKRIAGYRHAYYTGVSTIFMARLIGDLIENHPPLSGLYNLASEMVSKFELLCLARDAFKLDVEIEPDDEFVCHRNLDGSRLRRALGVAPPSWRDMMAELAADTTPYDRWRK
jgi:dTDP-4-dehydrorhamnose reductase